MIRRILPAVLAVGLIAAPALADDPVPPQPVGSRHMFAMGLGPVYWPELHDLDPASSPFAAELGRFHTWGVSLEFSYHHRAGSWGDVDGLIGVDVGFLIHENSREIEFLVVPFGGTFGGELLSNVIYLTPSARFVFADTRRWRFHAGLGAGWYFADFSEAWSDYYYDYDENELWEESSFGGYLSIGGDYRIWSKRPRWRMRFEHKTHLVDFGNTAPFAPDAGDLKGPIQSLFIGFVWHM